MAIRKLTDATLCKRLKLTPEGLKELRRAAQQTWKYIGYDILQANGEQDIPRAEVIEVVLDADHITMACHQLSPEVKATLSHVTPQHDYDALQSALLDAFQCKSYGL